MNYEIECLEEELFFTQMLVYPDEKLKGGVFISIYCPLVMC